MSRENVEIARRGYEYFVQNQDVLDELFHPDYVLDMSGFSGWPEQHTYRGLEGLRSFLADWLEPWDDYEFEVEELHDAGEKVVAVVRQRGISKANGVPVEMHLSHVTTYQDGKTIRTDMYATPAEGLEAAGLSE